MSKSSIRAPHHKAAESGDDHLVVTRYGIEFDARADWWPIDGRQGIDAASVWSLVSPELRAGLQKAFRAGARRYSWGTLIQYVYGLRHYQKSCFPKGEITHWRLSDLRLYRTVLMKEFGNEHYLLSVRSVLILWHKGSSTGVDKDLIASLNEMRLKGREAGRAVRVMDPDKGPFTEQELHSLVEGLNDAAERGALSLDAYSAVYLHVASGRRPVQSANLKCLDLVRQIGDPDAEYPEGRPLHLLAVPRAKQKGHAFRETRRAIDLSPQHFQLFLTQKESVQERFRRLLETSGWSLQPGDLEYVVENLPLYPAWSVIEAALDTAGQLRTDGLHGEALHALRRESEGSAWHRTPLRQGQVLIEACESVGALGRDGKPLRVTATRLRYSKGSGLARDGLPPTLIAYFLDQSTIQSVKIYIDNLPEHAAQINAALSQSTTLQNFASAFRGKLVRTEAEAVGGDKPEQSRVAYHGKGAATCGHLKQCGLDGGIPRACYTCSHFQPWADGPHEEFLAELEDERKDHVAKLGPESPVAKKCDKLISAVRYVVELCRQHREAESESKGEGELEGVL